MNSKPTSSPRAIEYVSAAAPVNMADDWYDYAAPEHFWMHRRFQVFRSLALPRQESRWAEVGCGNGAVQLQMSQQLDIEMDGIELNEYALQRNISDRGRLLCYNVFDEEPSLAESWDSIILFDVLEHIEDHEQFLKSVLYLLKPGGMLVINVPAFQHLWSAYDEAQGHVRRYRIGDLERVVHSQSNVSIRRWSYWGGPFVPLLLARRLVLKFSSSNQVVKTGFSTGSSLVNSALKVLSRCEWIPQHIWGTSLMMVLEKASAESP